MSEYDDLIIGAGLTGIVLSDLLARKENRSVLMIDIRDHIGGNCFDYIDEETGILVNRYGAHLFHTQHDIVAKYVTRFSEWERYEHSVSGFVDDKFVPIPVNIETVNLLTNASIKSVHQMNEWLSEHQVKIWKQWNKFPNELGVFVGERIKHRNDWDNRYFPGDKFQYLPKHGYTEWFEQILDDPRIDILLNTDYFDKSKYDFEAHDFEHVYYSGPIDSYFAQTGLEKLEYRSIIFEREIVENSPFYQVKGAVNYPQLKYGNFTRIIEYKHFKKESVEQQMQPHTVIFKEYSTDKGDPYYPVDSKRNRDLFAKYQTMALQKEDESGVYFVGRLANYRYFNMDETILNALQLFSKIHMNHNEDEGMEQLGNYLGNDYYRQLNESKCSFEISFIFDIDDAPNSKIFEDIAVICAHYKKETNLFWHFYVHPDSPQDFSYFGVAEQLKASGCHLSKANANGKYFDNLLVKESAHNSIIQHLFIGALRDVNIFIQSSVGIDEEKFSLLQKTIGKIKKDLYQNEQNGDCGTRPNELNNQFEIEANPNHFVDLSDSDFMATNALIQRLLQKQSTFLFDVFKRK